LTEKPLIRVRSYPAASGFDGARGLILQLEMPCDDDAH